ncbi:hypothetical protein U3516DRAFT_760159 [Neocallimastix sp. 'constans']
MLPIIKLSNYGKLFKKLPSIKTAKDNKYISSTTTMNDAPVEFIKNNCTSAYLMINELKERFSETDYFEIEMKIKKLEIEKTMTLSCITQTKYHNQEKVKKHLKSRNQRSISTTRRSNLTESEIG